MNGEMKEYLNQLEPEILIQAFHSEPPEGFAPLTILGCGGALPAFMTDFDLLTTADDRVKKAVHILNKIVPFFNKINLKPRTLFVGTTVSEYILLPKEVQPHALKGPLVLKMNDQRSSLIIVKDVPCDSPLLSGDENELSKSLMSSLEESGFILMSGQALAYIPITFASTEEYLQKFSKSRRRDFTRKLRSFSAISVETMRTGDDFFVDANVELLYQLFLNTYNNSSIHFDRLTLSFFRKVLKDDGSDGIVFLYRNREGIVAFNLCFIYRSCLVDKYIGFRYPEARMHNLYFLSWFHNLDFCIKNKLKTFIAGWTDPEIKAYLGAEFTGTNHAVYIKNPLLRFCLKRLSGFFESDKRVLEGIVAGKHP
jgi:hypothetical protein